MRCRRNGRNKAPSSRQPPRQPVSMGWRNGLRTQSKEEVVVKNFKVTLKVHPNPRRYQVMQIVGPDVKIYIGMSHAVRAGDVLSEEDASTLGDKAVLTTKPV